MEIEKCKSEGPIEDVLFLPELLEKILSHLSRQSLLRCRLVCSVWRDCAFSVFQNNPSILPSIEVPAGLREPYSNIGDHDQDTLLSRICETLKPPCSLPLRVDVIYATSNSFYPKFFTDFAQNIVCIEADDDAFEHILGLTNFPKLRKIVLAGCTEGYERIQDFFLTQGSRLTELILDGSGKIRIGAMPNLKVLKLWNEAYLSSDESIYNLLPSLRDVCIGDQDYRVQNTKMIENLFSHGDRFEKVISLEIHEIWFIEKDNPHPEAVTQIVQCFPNLKRLDWTSWCELSDLNPAIHLVFSGFKSLTSLRLMIEGGDMSELLELLTNLSVKDIPDEEQLWNDAIEDTTKTLLNLKNLKSFNLGHKGYGDYSTARRIPRLASQFLLKAVFLRMENLQKILFRHIRYDSECIQIWHESGREFETIGLDDDQEENHEN